MRLIICCAGIIVLVSQNLRAQDCHSSLTQSTVSASTSLVSNPTSSHTAEIKFLEGSYTITGGNTFNGTTTIVDSGSGYLLTANTVDDITSGYLVQFDINSKIPATIQFNCNAIIPTSFETPYGVLEITEG